MKKICGKRKGGVQMLRLVVLFALVFLGCGINDSESNGFSSSQEFFPEGVEPAWLGPKGLSDYSLVAVGITKDSTTVEVKYNLPYSPEKGFYAHALLSSIEPWSLYQLAFKKFVVYY